MWESGLEVPGGRKRPHRRFHKVLGTLRHLERGGGNLESTKCATSGQVVSKLMVTSLNVYEYYLEPYLEADLNIVNELITSDTTTSIKDTKHSSNKLLHLVSFFETQTLF